MLDKAIPKDSWDKLEEIRIFKKGTIVLCIDSEKKYVTSDMKLSDKGQAYFVDETVPDDIIHILTGCSRYAYEYHLLSGYITAPGGHRVGFTGTGVIAHGKVSSIKDITAVNIRVARELNILPDISIQKIVHSPMSNIMIVSPPKCGKTTLLRILAKEISSAKKLSSVCIVDERGEICSCDKGVPYYDMGLNTCIVSGIPKTDAFSMLVRTMAPDVIICDEITTEKEVDAIKDAILSGVNVIFTAHGKNKYVLKEKEVLNKLIGLVDNVIELSDKNGPGTIECVERCIV